MKRSDLVQHIKNSEFSISKTNLHEDVVDYVIQGHEGDCDKDSLKEHLKWLISKIKTKLSKHSSSYDRFLKKESRWLQEEIKIPPQKDLEAAAAKTAGGGRPKKSWEELAPRSKRQKVSDLSSEHTELLIRAAEKSARTSGMETFEL